MYIRKIVDDVKKLYEKKIVLLSGPRQVGKTFLSKNMLTQNYIYLNYDSSEDRKIIHEKSWSRDYELIIFDELHKMSNWKIWLKGIYDKEELSNKILVTGSARMDTFKKGGDSLAGRHYHIRLNPFVISEVCKSPDKRIIKKMLSSGSFPEPFIEKDETIACSGSIRPLILAQGGHQYCSIPATILV